ncbi:cation transporter [Pleomorphomonas diazotrophica]|uniref:Cation transporter n=1 Tax=Pleomorphomonas diazotrophica TaxID=1166257 RepID=A0A1I4VM65_9HYPH|nr:CDF family Co(II)/Ni(II) efflux transporter DmeF [Pleomorphomonas diazotrophica]PKR89611.1 cation transporter [Pleomorphomonas diazotrophica]SFN02344.1 cation diffusion facilitator family transporter [Pleomorphomonas diazotrophica]
MQQPDAGGVVHDHVFLGHHHERNTRRVLWVVLLTLSMMIGEIIAGLVFKSMALLADGFHMATHAGALTVAAVAYLLARRYAGERRFTFGTGKIGDLAGFASALILGLVALGIAIESVFRFLNPQPVAFSEATAVAVLGLLVNLLSAVLLGPDHHHHDHDHAEHGHDNNLRSAYVHVLADALTSVLAIAALLGGRFLGWIWLDPAMGLVGATVIAVWSWSLMRAASSVLLDMADPHVEGEIRELVEEKAGARIVDLHLWRVGPAGHAAIVSVIGDDAEDVRRRLRPVHEIVHLTVEAREPVPQPPAA